jgi:hypothetical protein
MWQDPGWAFGVAFIILAFSLRKALPRLLQTIADRQATATPAEANAGELVEVIDELRRRMGELEERVDFTERMLATYRDRERVAPPDHEG